jgi:uncharacterized protein with FMN-binding domain
MRRAGLALVVTVIAVVLLARFETEPPRTVNPDAGVKLPRAVARARAAEPAPPPPPPGSVSADGPAMTTPFSVIQVRATLLHGRLVGVTTVSMSGDGPHTEALNARAEPILRAEALEAHSADVDVVSGATSSSQIWIDSLKGAIRRAKARGG